MQQVDIIRFDEDGSIVDFKVMLRPPEAGTARQCRHTPMRHFEPQRHKATLRL
jgi:hypothetical protein